MSDLSSKLKRRFEEKQRNRVTPKQPRYDDVYYEGVRALDDEDMARWRYYDSLLNKEVP